MKNLVLIGMPGCGKSTAGVLIAKALGYGFIDGDLVIQRREGCLLRELIEKKGVEGFIRAEEESNCSIKATRSVIATGGSAVYSQKGMDCLKQNGIAVYLRLSYETIVKRLGKTTTSRGVVIRRGESILDLYNERTPLYEKFADFTVDCEGKSIEETVKAVCDLMKNEGLIKK